MANSPLVSVRKLSPNCTKPRNHAIDRLTPHHTAGNSPKLRIAGYGTGANWIVTVNEAIE